MKNVRRILSTYSADIFGINSALYELGGLIVMHDASGCNSTYNTHDEPRWYDNPSMIYISALVEKDVILGNDDKLVNDIVTCVNELPKNKKPKFIVVSSALIPFFMCTDMDGIAKKIEAALGIKTFAFKTNSMSSYIVGTNLAFKMLVDNFCSDKESNSDRESNNIKINLIGVTPLDFSIVGNLQSLEKFFEAAGYTINSCMAMGDTLEKISTAGNVDVNVVLSSAGISAATTLNKKFGTPYAIGLPTCKENAALIEEMISLSSEDNKCRKLTASGIETIEKDKKNKKNNHASNLNSGGAYIIGEPVFANSVKHNLRAIGYDNAHIICPTEYDCGILEYGDLILTEEEDFEKILNKADLIIADPIYRRVLTEENKKKIRFINLPHEAFSGRMYRSHIPVFCTANNDFTYWLEERIGTQEEIFSNDIMLKNEPFIKRSY